MTIEERDRILNLLKEERDDDDWGDWNIALMKAEVIVEEAYEEGLQK